MLIWGKVGGKKSSPHSFPKLTSELLILALKIEIECAPHTFNVVHLQELKWLAAKNKSQKLHQD